MGELKPKTKGVGLMEAFEYDCNSHKCEVQIQDYIEGGGKNLWDGILIVARHIDKLRRLPPATASKSVDVGKLADILWKNRGMIEI